MKRLKKGSALTLVLIFSLLMFTIALAYSKLTQTSQTRSVQIDERVKLDYAIEGLCELALLKYQLFPQDFKQCCEFRKHGNNTYFDNFLNDNQFKMTNSDCVSSFNNNAVQTQVTRIELLTSGSDTNQYKKMALLIEAKSVTTAGATQKDKFGHTIDKTGTKIYRLDRYADTSLIDN